MRRIDTMPCFFLMLVAIASLGPVLAVAAEEISPFPSRHLNPIVQTFGLPAAAPATILPAGRTRVGLRFEGSNNFSVESSPGEDLLLDGETYRVTLGLRYGVSKRLEVGVDLPYLFHQKGIFDGFIEDFHSTFGFSNQGRSDFGRNQLTYRYVRDGRTIFAVKEPVSDIGDLLVHGAVQLYRTKAPAHRALALRATLKLPTGEPDKLTGSGSTDFALQLVASDSALLASLHLSLFGGIGGLLIGDADLLEDQQRDLAAFGFLGFGWHPLDWLEFKLQLDAHSSLFKESELRPIDSYATQLVGGFTFKLPKENRLDLAISENVLVETAPDVSLILAWRKQF